MADSGMRHHADLVAGLVRDGDTVEFGIGKLQTSIVHALAAHQNLQVWSGMATTPIVELLDRGVVRGNASIQLGCALGDREFYDRCSDDDSFYFRPASETHDVGRVSSIKNFCAINSAVEVDLLGQVNSDVVNGKLVAGVGGLPPFISGALASAGGRSVIALPSTTSSGKHSRIVTRLCRPGAVAVNRSSADYVVTEHGVASLRGASIQVVGVNFYEAEAPSFSSTFSAVDTPVAQSSCAEQVTDSCICERVVRADQHSPTASRIAVPMPGDANCEFQD